MDDLRRALSDLDSIETPDLWPEIERRAASPELAPLPGAGRFQTMFSATKFVIAGAIVALFGGFLLAGVLTTPDTAELPAGTVSPESTRLPVQLPAEIPNEIDWGTLETPLGPARWVHLRGDATTLPGQLFGLVSTPDEHLVTEAGGEAMRIWRSPDLIDWSAEDLDIPADTGELWAADGAFWLSTSGPGALWRSPDGTSWEQVRSDLATPGPEGYAWVLQLGEPVVSDGAAIVPFEWETDFWVVARGLPGVDGIRWPTLIEVEPGVYSIDDWLVGTDNRGTLATVRFEETEDGLRVIDHSDGTLLKSLEGVALDFIDRITFDVERGQDLLPPVRGLAVLEGDRLGEVELPDEIRRADQTAWTTDGPGFTAYSVGSSGLVDVHRSQDGREWQVTDVIGDEVGEPADIVYIDAWRDPLTLESTDGLRWTLSTGGTWTQSESSEPEMFDIPLGSGWIQGPLGAAGNPITREEEVGPGNVRPRIWYQPDAGEPEPIDITEMGIPINDGISGPNCGGSEGLVSANTLVTTFSEECEGLREFWIITFDDLPA